MSIVTKESNPELYNALFPEDEIKDFTINSKSITIGRIDATKVPLDKLPTPIYRSIIKIGNMGVLSFSKYNKFQKKMIKLFFGFEVEDYER